MLLAKSPPMPSSTVNDLCDECFGNGEQPPKTAPVVCGCSGGGTKKAELLPKWSVDSRCGWKLLSEFEKTQLDHDRQAGPESVYLAQHEPRIVPLASSI